MAIRRKYPRKIRSRETSRTLKNMVIGAGNVLSVWPAPLKSLREQMKQSKVVLRLQGKQRKSVVLQIRMRDRRALESDGEFLRDDMRAGMRQMLLKAKEYDG